MFLDTGDKTECFGCESCQQACSRQAIIMIEDGEGFRYPRIDTTLCIHCDSCRRACPYAKEPEKHREKKYVFGGYTKDTNIRYKSTSGGAFSAVVEAYCDNDYVIFGAEAKGLLVFHSYITEKKELQKYRKSKYLQSNIGEAYKEVRMFLSDEKKVLFSGTPCQIAGLYAYLNAMNCYSNEKLLTVEVVCEGVPSTHYIRKMDDYTADKYGARIETLDYRYKDKSLFGNGKWDFEVMKIQLKNQRNIKIDRWFNPFWSIWLNHLMSRPSCYHCPFAEQGRIADITLGDLWGVHLYCPELYGKNGGASLAIGNTEKGSAILKQAQQYMFGHELQLEDAIKYQSPIRKHIEENPQRKAFMFDLESDMSFTAINHKWAKKPTLKLLWQKYVWGNRQKISVWNIKQTILKREYLAKAEVTRRKMHEKH